MTHASGGGTGTELVFEQPCDAVVVRTSVQSDPGCVLSRSGRRFVASNRVDIRRIVSRNVTLRHVIICRVASRRVALRRVASHRVSSVASHTSRRVAWCRVASCRVPSRHLTVLFLVIIINYVHRFPHLTWILAFSFHSIRYFELALLNAARMSCWASSQLDLLDPGLFDINCCSSRSFSLLTLHKHVQRRIYR